MHGKVKMFSSKKGYGFIKGNDNEDYFFHISNVDDNFTINCGDFVNFTPFEGDKGKVAKNVKQGNIKNGFIKCGDVRIKISNIKNYGISKKPVYFVKVYEHTINESENILKRAFLDNYKWNGLLQHIPTSEVNERENAGFSWTFGKHKYIKTYSGEIKETSKQIEMKTSDLIEKMEDALYITTYQNDNFVFVKTDVSFNIYDKLSEIDSYMAA